MKPRTLSREEEAELARSNKKVKDSHHADFNDGPNDGSPSRNIHNHWNKANASFRDKLVGEIPGAFAHAFDFTDQMDADSDSENDEEDIKDLRRGLVAIKLSKDTKKRIRERWCKAIIVKLVGRSVSFSYMQSKLNQLWRPESRMDVVDLTHGFFLVRFFSKEDLNSILRRGPWFLGDHFLSLRPWEPFFKPSSANISLVAVWVRLYELPIELYEAELLREIGNSIGKVLRIDTHTAMEARGKYARLCIQIDINKPLIDTILIGRFEQAVIYEGIQKLCFSCGRLGHLKEACPYTVRKSGDSVATAEAAPDGNVGSRDGHEDCRTDTPSTLPDKSVPSTSVVEEDLGQYGPWMIVTRKKGGYKGTKQNPSSGGTTKFSGKLATQFPTKDMRAEHSKDGPSLPRHDDTRSKKHNEMGFNLGPSQKLGNAGKPNATLFGKSDSLPDLAINKKKHSHSVRGKKIFARNLYAGNPLKSAVADPLQAFDPKFTSLSTSASTSFINGAEASTGSAFNFMATKEDGLGINSASDCNSSGCQRWVQSKDHIPEVVVQPEGEASLDVEAGGVDMLSDFNSKEGSDDENVEDDRMVPEKGGDSKSSF